MARARSGVTTLIFSPSQIILENAGTHGLHVPSATAGPASYAAPSALAETEGSIRCLGSWTPANQGELGTGRDSPGPLEMLSVDGTGYALGNGLQKEGGLDRCFQHGVGGSVKTCGRRRKEVSISNSSSVLSPSCLFTRPEGAPRYGPLGQHDSDGLHNESTRRALFEALFTLVECLLKWAQHNLHSLRAMYVPGKLNQGADMLSWSNVSSEEWTLHPQVVQEIWEIFGKAEVDLFASKDNSHCLTYYSKDMDALDHDWPSHLLYAFLPIALIPQVIRQIRENKHKVILVVPLWRNQHWFSELSQLLTAAPWPIPLRRDLLSQGNRTMWHPRPELWALHLWPLDVSSPPGYRGSLGPPLDDDPGQVWPLWAQPAASRASTTCPLGPSVPMAS